MHLKEYNTSFDPMTKNNRRVFDTPSGGKICVGRNAEQNDALSLAAALEKKTWCFTLVMK